MKKFHILHRTAYRYSAPVALGPHRLMVRPRDSHDLKVEETALVIDPQPTSLRWLHDVSGNSVAIANFAGVDETDHFMVESQLDLTHYGLVAPDLELNEAELWPFEYDAAELFDLVPYRQRLYPGTDAAVPRWACDVARELGTSETQALLIGMMQHIRDTVPYHRREDEGVQRPETTLEIGGTCRDFAVLMIEALRCLGFATRFVSGYLYDPAADPTSEEGTEGHVGGGATHAWLDVYLPGAGWVEFDPTNALYGGADLIRVATARNPEAALPLTGTFKADEPITSLMTVEVTVDKTA